MVSLDAVSSPQAPGPLQLFCSLLSFSCLAYLFPVPVLALASLFIVESTLFSIVFTLIPLYLRQTILFLQHLVFDWSSSFTTVVPICSCVMDLFHKMAT